MKRIALFPGSFDPFTKGHEDIVLRGLSVFDEVVIAIGNNSTKSRYFDLDYMENKIKETYASEPRIKVSVFEGLTSNFAKKAGANFLLRGLRNTTDFEYENTICQANKFLNTDLETFLLITSPELAFISSSIVRDIHKHGGNVDAFLPYKL